ncbi:NADP-dependent isocitrate dehydrogenase [Micavibrio aeruginosavorus]|uniref:Isocitrate dehydrogenase [NADP] n=1 Tax=Micavibrio aeruginosavorus EPB TaxID=349215 RepID=M4VKD7_9BACT|nr:NADP-dependent isocitrate dehydrogenase [Micavibrio aeruginosavorus]AGH98541.1 Isocitrate dehydrogenase [NADP] [Micavibrio aeruginosavorus EPB]
MVSTSKTNLVPITVARGDGIGPEIMDATLKILDAAGAALAIEEIAIGEAVYKSGIKSGIEDSAWDSLRRTKVFLKSPITTPQGGGFKSLNVTVRKSLGLFANVRPCVSYAPYVETNHPTMDLVIVRENEEDLYGGIEYRHTQDVVESVKIISRPGSERIIRYAFEYARANGRKKVTCMSKDNIMKMADGLFHRTFDEIGAEYPDIEQSHMIIDIGSAKVAVQPHMFDVIVTENLYGDIISDIAAEVTGSVGLGGSSNVGTQCAMFEAIHGSAPDIAGKGIANPSGLLLGAVMMLVHIGQKDIATRVHNAWLKTIEDGIHTGDIYRLGKSVEKVGTDGFSKAVIERIGATPEKLRAVDYGAPVIGAAGGMVLPPLKPRVTQDKKLVGVDVFVNIDQCDPNGLADRILALGVNDNGLAMESIANRGTKVWPDGQPETFCSDHWRLRFMSNSGIKHDAIMALLAKFDAANIDFIKVENLYNFDGKPGFTAAQGE